MSGRVALLAGAGESTNIIYHGLLRSFDLAGVVIEAPVPRGEFLKKRIKRLGISKVAGQILFRGLVVPSLRWSSRRRIRQILEDAGLDRRAIPEAQVTRVASVNSRQAIEALRRLQPDVVVVNGTRIISADVLNAVPAKFINTHAGITPLYRGVHGAYWALVENDRPRCGVTVHLVDTGIDTGKILGQAVITPTADDNFVTYAYLQLAEGVSLLRRAVGDALAGNLAFQPPPEGKSRLWSHPTIFEYLAHRKKAGVK